MAGQARLLSFDFSHRRGRRWPRLLSRWLELVAVQRRNVHRGRGSPRRGDKVRHAAAAGVSPERRWSGRGLGYRRWPPPWSRARPHVHAAAKSKAGVMITLLPAEDGGRK